MNSPKNIKKNYFFFLKKKKKVASLYEVIKHEHNHDDDNFIGRYFVDKGRYEELAQQHASLQAAYNKLAEKCKNLDYQVQHLQGQFANKSEDVTRLHNKVNAWANQFGMRRATLASLDAQTIDKIKELVANDATQTKQLIEN
ncbi:hypothetical protein RFI_38253, partial [Reticulomyxa filosa]